MSRLVIFDADSIIYTVAWNFRNKKVKKMVEIMTNKFLSDVLMQAKATHYVGFYGSKEDGALPNFRLGIDPLYKAKRPPTPDFVIQWRPTIHDVFKTEWKFAAVDGMEADDAVLIAVNKYRDEFDSIVVATFDKDLRQIPNITFYDMQKHTTEFITELEAARHLGKQMLMGDASDNVPGIPGTGKVTAKNLLQDCTTVGQVKFKVARAYQAYEQSLYNKQMDIITKEIHLSLEGTTADTIPAQYKGLTGARLDRMIRINTVKELLPRMQQIIPGGWKKYFEQQYSLLAMLPSHDTFVVPDVQASPFIDIVTNNDTADDVAPVVHATMDDFLTI
jgi:5'-3' exonuclease